MWLLLGSIDLDVAKDRILAARPGALIGAIAVFTFQILILVWRWQAVISAMNINLPFLKLL